MIEMLSEMGAAEVWTLVAIVAAVLIVLVIVGQLEGEPHFDADVKRDLDDPESAASRMMEER